MARKNSANAPESDDSCDESNEDEIEEQVIKAIKALPTLEEKVQAIALNGYLIEKREIDKQMQKQTSAIEWNYRQKYRKEVEEIQQIIQGTFAFNDNDYHEIGELLTEEEHNVKSNYFTNEPVSQYWLKVLQSSDVIGPTITPKDQPILKHLQKIQAQLNQEGTSLSATFTFSENQWFTNKTIKKELEIDGEDIKKSFGDQIDWKEGKNITIKIVKKKKKKNKQVKTKTVKEESFFNFFKDVEPTSDSEDNQEQNEEESQVEQLELQYEITNHIYEEIIPRSIEYYLGIVGGAGLGELADFQDVKGDDDDDDQAEKVNKKKNKKRKSSKDSGN